MTQDATWWDKPDQPGDDSPVIRHAPDQHNYHVPDYEQTGKMRGSKVGRFALIPASNRDGTSKGFDATVAGPMHVDPDAPDGGVVFDPSTVRKSDLNRAVAQSYYPHQAFYQLGTPAPLMGLGSKKQASVAATHHQQNGFDVDHGHNPHLPRTYVTPSASANGRQSEFPAYVANGQGSGPASQNPAYYFAQEEQSVNSVPPLNSLSPVQMSGPSPAAPQQPQYQQQQPPQQQPPQQWQPQAQYAPPTYYQPPHAYQPPPMDPNLQAMMQGMVGLQQTVAALAAQVQRPAHLPPTTGVSSTPMPVMRSPVSSTPVDSHGGRRIAQAEDFDDEDARPIRKRVKRDKKSQDVEDTDVVPESENPSESRSLVRRGQHQDRDEDPQSVRAYHASQQEPEGVIVGFETLGLKFVTGPLPIKAKKQVVFEIPGAGRHMARFHDIIDAKECVVLVYDTRFEDGQQYVPPELDEVPITLIVAATKKSYKVSSMGLTYSFGVFDHIVLVKHDPGEVPDSDEE